MNWRRLEGLGILLLLTLVAHAQERSELRVGHWVEIKGALEADDLFRASSVELSRPDDDEEQLVGTVTHVASDRSWFELLGMRVHIGRSTHWRKVSVDELEGRRVKVSGHYRGPRKFSAGSISLRGEGRDRIVGRIDARREGEDGLELDVMRWLVIVPQSAQYKREEDLEDYPLLPQRGPTRAEVLENGEELRGGRDDDDDIPVTVRLSDALALGLRLETKRSDEREFDLNGAKAADRIDDEITLRGELLYTPDDSFYGLLGFRHRWHWRNDQRKGYSYGDGSRIAELYGYWRDVGGLPLDLQLGRQDFDERREWLWDENLDALRLIAHPRPDLRIEMAAATHLRDSSERFLATSRYIVHAIWGDDSRSLEAYLVDTRTDLDPRDYPFFYGVRALGEWLEGHDVWLELGGVSGYEGENDIRGFGYDLGTTWSPDVLDPWYFTAGYAFGSGDKDPNDGTDQAFRQTGIQDNNDTFGGVTSFKYYGELLQPELSNLGILTLGIGRRFGSGHSLDLVYHRYQQAEAAPFLRNSDLKTSPDGIHTELGDEFDLILGSRFSKALSLELVLARFQPGAAFASDAPDAFAGRLQLRFRF